MAQENTSMELFKTQHISLLCLVYFNSYCLAFYFTFLQHSKKQRIRTQFGAYLCPHNFGTVN